MSVASFEFSATLQLWTNGKSPALRNFVTVDRNISEQIQHIAQTMPRKGRWSVKVEVRILFYVRKTSVFPDKQTGSYFLLIKREVRKELQIAEGDEVLVNLTLL